MNLNPFKTIREIEAENKKLSEYCNNLFSAKVELQKLVASLREDLNRERIPEGDSTITFSIDKTFKVKTFTKVNPDIIKSLVRAQYIEPHQEEDTDAHHLAFVLLANEVSQQLLDEYQGELITDSPEKEEQEEDDNNENEHHHRSE